MNERAIFDAALEIADPQARRAFVEKACAGNPGLLIAVESLLKSHDAAGSFLDIPVAEQMGKIPSGVAPANPENGAAAVDKTRLSQAGDADDDDSDVDRQPDLSFLQPSSKPGSIGVLAHYEVLSVLGRGAFGIVFKAFDEKLHRLVAIKVMNPQMASTSPPRKRFLREARSAAAIKHENVVQVYSVEEQPLPYLVMEFIDGQTLKQKLDSSGPLETPEVLHIARQIASGLAAAQAMGLIHRDIKPGNILLELGAEQRVKISDFGLARAADDASLTRTGVISGTPMYMAPEQATGQPLDHRADLFSLGSVLYQMACGRPPFRAATTVAVLRRVVEDTPRPMQEILPEIPDWVVAIVTKLHAKKPEDRFQTAKEVADLLARCQSELQLNGKVTCVTVTERVARPESSKGVEPQSTTPFAKPQGVPPDATSTDVVTGPVSGTALAAGVSLAAGFSPAKSTPRDSAIPVASAIPLTAAAALPVRRRWIPKARVALVLAGVLLMLLAAVVYRIQTDQGTLVVTIDDPAVQAILEQDGLVIRDKHSDRTWTIKATESQPLPSGEYQLKLGQQLLVTDESGAELKTDTFALKRNGEFRVRVTLEQAARVADKKPATSDPDRRAAEYVLSIGGNIKIKDNGQERDIKAEGDLPRGAFELLGVDLHDNPKVSDAGLVVFKDCKNVTVLDLQATHVSDAGLVDFKDCKNLMHLNLSQTPVSDAGLAHFNHCKNLTGLYLNNTQLTDAGLAHFKDCKNLTTLILASTQVSDAGLAHFKDCKNLEVLFLSNNQVTDAGLAHFEDCKKLTGLHLGSTYVSDAGLVHFKDCKNLTFLSLFDNPVTDAGLAHFKECKNLSVLLLNATQLTDAGLAQFKDCKNLTHLDLRKTKVTDAGLAHFQECKNLEELFLDSTQLSDAGLAALASVPSLSKLHLADTRVSLHGHEQLKAALPKCQIAWSEPNRSVAESVLALGGTVEIGSLDKPESRPVQVAADLPGDYFQVRRVSLAGVTKPLDPLRPLLAWLTFPQFDRLESIDLSGSTGLDYSFLVPIHGLRELTLANAGLNDAALANLPKLPTLQRLVLDGNDIRGNGLTHLSQQPQLIDLSLSHPNLTNLSAENLAELKPLKRLSLAGSGMTNAGIMHLANLTNLESLDLRRTKATAAGIDELKAALPKFQIQRDGMPNK